MPHRVKFAKAAEQDLDDIAAWVSAAAGSDTAYDYVLRLRNACAGLADFPRRGTPHSRGRRSIPFKRRATIYYRVGRTTVTIVAIHHRGRDTPA